MRPTLALALIAASSLGPGGMIEEVHRPRQSFASVASVPLVMKRKPKVSKAERRLARAGQRRRRRRLGLKPLI